MNEYEYIKHNYIKFELRVKDKIKERPSQLFMQLMQLQKESLKKFQACMTSCCINDREVFNLMLLTCK